MYLISKKRFWTRILAIPRLSENAAVIVFSESIYDPPGLIAFPDTPGLGVRGKAFIVVLSEIKKRNSQTEEQTGR